MDAAPAPAAPARRHPLDAATRAAIHDLHALRPTANAIVPAFFALWAVGAWVVLAMPSWPARLLGVIAIGLALHALATFMHEGSHGNLWRRRSLDRWTGFLCSIGTFLAPTAYRVTHLEHHRHLRGERDPEEFTNFSTRAWVQSAAFWAWALIGGATYPVFVPCVGFARGTRRERRDIVIEYVLMSAIYAIVFSWAARTGRMRQVLAVWIVPLVVTALLTNLRGWAEHAMTVKGDAWTSTRTVTSSRLMTALMGGTNFHLEHHLFPGIPWYHLRRAHEILATAEAEADSIVYGSYLRFVWDAVRSGIHGVARARP